VSLSILSAGRHSTSEASAQPSFTNGLRPSVSRVPAGRRIPINTHSRDYRVRDSEVVGWLRLTHRLELGLPSARSL
jgi:hypothetical protein